MPFAFRELISQSLPRQPFSPLLAKGLSIPLVASQGLLDLGHPRAQSGYPPALDRACDKQSFRLGLRFYGYFLSLIHPHEVRPHVKRTFNLSEA